MRDPEDVLPGPAETAVAIGSGDRAAAGQGRGRGGRPGPGRGAGRRPGAGRCRWPTRAAPRTCSWGRRPGPATGRAGCGRRPPGRSRWCRPPTSRRRCCTCWTSRNPNTLVGSPITNRSVAAGQAPASTALRAAEGQRPRAGRAAHPDARGAVLQRPGDRPAAAVRRRRDRPAAPVGDGRKRQRLLTAVRRTALVFACVPVSTYLANTVPWWRSAHPLLVIVAGGRRLRGGADRGRPARPVAARPARPVRRGGGDDVRGARGRHRHRVAAADARA